jgi:NADPH-dependent ferric siderophore reductase
MTTPVRRRPAPIRTTVSRLTQLSPHFVRVTLAGEDLSRFRWPGPAGHLKLILPEPGTAQLVLPEPDADGLVVFDRSLPITLRTYTARRFDPAAGELDLDVFLHGTGPASRWAESASKGDSVAVTVPRSAGFTEDPAADWILIAGDASALPAIATIVPALTRPATILAELDDQADSAALDARGPVTWLAAAGSSGDELERAMLKEPLATGHGQVWVAAEASVIRRIRSGLLPALSREQLTTRGYWRGGEANHPDHDYGED